MTDAVLELERVAALGWQAAHVDHLGAWLLRADGGFTMRANSVLPLGDPGRPLDDALAEAGAWYGRYGLPLRMTVPSPVCDDLGRALDGRGWERGVRVLVMAADLPAADEATDPGPVVLGPVPTLAWQAAYRAGTGRDLPDAGRRLLVRADQVAFAEVRDGEDAVAIGRATVVDGWLGLTAVHVAPGRRRRGLATRVVDALAAWARRRGAARAYLQVAAPNAPAIALYRRWGFGDHHTYVHMSAPR